MNQKERLDLAQWVVRNAVEKGADEAAVVLNNRREIEVEYRDKQLDKLKESTKNSLSIKIYTSNRYSSHSTSDLRKDSLKRLIGEAVLSTKYLAEDKYRSLPDPKYYPKDSQPELMVTDSDYEKISAEKRKRIAAQLEQVSMAQSDKIISTIAGYGDVISRGVQVHSNGFSGHWKSTLFSAGSFVTVNDGKGGRPADWYWPDTRFFKDLPEFDYIGKEAADRALRKIGQKKIDSGKYDMIIENRSVPRVLSMLQQPMTARAIQQKQSFLDGMLGKKIASEKLTVIDDPFIQKGLGSRHFDGEGLAAKKRTMIEKGVLQQYYVDDYYGRKLGMEPTSGTPSNLIFEHGDKKLEELIRTMEKGIFVTGFLGGNSNPTTGDFSYGIVGLLVENGRMTQPINEMNISGNAKDFWNQLVELGTDVYPYSSVRSPSMLFEKVSFSGV